jgi:hypothetical protein
MMKQSNLDSMSIDELWRLRVKVVERLTADCR